MKGGKNLKKKGKRPWGCPGADCSAVFGYCLAQSRLVEFFFLLRGALWSCAPRCCLSLSLPQKALPETPRPC